MISAGADVIDVGGESTRPGAEPVDEVAERERVVPVIEALAAHSRISVDTRKAAVAEAAVAAGATLINDVSASLWPVAAAAGVGWVAMHMRGDPQTMQVTPATTTSSARSPFPRRTGHPGRRRRRPRGVDRPRHRLRQDGDAQPGPAPPPRSAGRHRMAGARRHQPQVLPRAPGHARAPAARAGPRPPGGVHRHDRVGRRSTEPAMVRVHDVAATVAAVKIMETPVTA